MTLTLELTPEQEVRLRATARLQGTEPADVLFAWLNALPDEHSQVQNEPMLPAERTWGAVTLAALADPNAPPRPIPKQLPVTIANGNLSALFAKWEAEDAALAPKAYAERERQWGSFRNNMNAPDAKLVRTRSTDADVSSCERCTRNCSALSHFQGRLPRSCSVM